MSESLTPMIEALEDAFYKGMNDLAKLGEESIREDHMWEDDTESLLTSITGYAPEVGDPYKHFGDPVWTFAQKHGNEFGRRRLRDNPPENYYPHTEELDTGDNPTAIVTAFVGYGDDEPIADRVELTFLIGLTYMQQKAEECLGARIKRVTG